MEGEMFERSRAMLGEDAMRRIAALRVAVFGLGGVGSWCAEALVRTGVRKLTLVDDDTVAASNVNRQRQAMPSTIGQLKAETLRDQLLAIVPDAEIHAIPERYTPETVDRFDAVIDGADFVIDAIDSVDCKAHLIRRVVEWKGGKCCQCGNVANSNDQLPIGNSQLPTIFSSMGAALRMDPTKVRVSPFGKIAGDGLARALRNRFRRDGFPIPNHLCVHSEEPPRETATGTKGSLMPVTCAFGMALAYLVISRAGSVFMPHSSFVSSQRNSRSSSGTTSIAQSSAPLS